QDVEDVLKEIGAAEEGGAPIIEAWNKIDRLSGDEAVRLRTEASRRENVVVLSALSGEGIDGLLTTTADCLREGAAIYSVSLPVEAGEAIAWVHANGEVLESEEAGMDVRLRVRLSEANWARFQTHFGAAAKSD
ncbi:MAG TPA: GTPase HflX, partial [Allosphingosinicella sp.]